MNINKYRELLALSISDREEWMGMLENSNPGHYGIVDSDVSISINNIWVDIPRRKFTIKDVKFHFTLQLGSSSDEDGFQQGFTRSTNGQGQFYYDEKIEKIIIETLELDFDLNLFS